MSSDDAGQLREAAQGAPAAPLRPCIASYAGYRHAGLPPGQHRGLPSPYLTMIITLDEPLHLAAHPDPGQPPGRYDTLLGGLHTTPAIITHEGSQSGIQVSLRPLGARALLGLPAGELAHIDAEGSAVLGRIADELRERVLAAPTWTRRFALIDEILRQVRDNASPGPAVGHAWRALVASRGLASVPELARQAGCSGRHLHARFATEIGLAPKAAARVVRFDRARRLLQRRVLAGRSADLAALAAACGYYDQAHLAREFNALAGCPPSRWVAEEFRNVQAGAEPPMPDSPA